MKEENIRKSSIIERTHVLSGDEVLIELKTNSLSGMSPAQIFDSLKENGSNSIPPGKKTTNLERLWTQINSTLIYILMAGSAVSFGFNHTLDGAFILGVVFINVGLGFFMESKAENATEVLKSMMSPSAQVLRGGDRQTVDADLLVVGDIFFLQPGDIVPADGRVLKAVDLSVLESPLTGEAHAILKTHLPIARLDAPLAERKCMVYSGTQVLKGTATCVAAAVGVSCEMGKISSMLVTLKEAKTPLLMELEKFGTMLSVVIAILAVAAFLVAYFRGYPLNEALQLTIGIAVAAIPEGLPSCITVTFAVGVRYMADRHAIVKSLPAVETLGSVSVICSDKTGTLTINKMTVKQIFTSQTTIELSDDGVMQTAHSSAGEKMRGVDSVMTHLLPGILCNDGAILLDENTANMLLYVVETKEEEKEDIEEDEEEPDSPLLDAATRNSSFRRGAYPSHLKVHQKLLGFEVPSISLIPSASGSAMAASVSSESETASRQARGLDDCESPKPHHHKLSVDIAMSTQCEIQGDPTETCLLFLAVSMVRSAFKVKRLRRETKRLGEIPFDSSTKYMATLHFVDYDTGLKLMALSAAEDPTYIAPTSSSIKGRKMKVVFVKGAPEKVVALCEAPENSSGPIFGRCSRFWLYRAATAATKGMRVLGLAFKIVPDDFEFSGHLAPCSGFTMSALVGIMDPPRPDAIVAIQLAQQAGICVKMITGDHPVTALAIGKMLGLNATNKRFDEESRGNEQALTGADLDRMEGNEQFDEMVLNNDIFARTTPEHKLRIVRSLQRQNFVCSMTGDGVNDAPALKAANIGVAMGITGTEVAKDAANMILTDDNFATIVDAIRVGRCTYNNLIKIITFVLPSNGGQAFSILGALIIGTEVPITALQILWVNMVTSATLGLVLAFDKPGADILLEKPRHRNKRLFGRFLRWRVVFVTLLLVVAVLGIFHWERERISSVDELRTIAVNTLAFAQIGYLFNCRNLRRNVSIIELFSGNQYIYVGILVVVCLQVIFTYTPPLQYVFDTRPIDGESWAKMLFVCVAVFVLVEGEKYVSIQRHEYLKKRRRECGNRKRSGSAVDVGAFGTDATASNTSAAVITATSGVSTATASAVVTPRNTIGVATVATASAAREIERGL